MKVSVCIPYHDSPKSAFYLSRLLKSISEQTYKDYEVVLTKEGQMARNLNAAIIKSKGDIIQLMGMDDYFAHPDSLKNIVENFKDSSWMITPCIHDQNGHLYNHHTPHWTDDIYTGNNRLGGIATLSMKREKALLFEEPLKWLVDCDLYYRLYLKYGFPTLSTDIGIVIGTDNDSVSATISSIDKQHEVTYLLRKYG